jgi:hypothetical protein
MSFPVGFRGWGLLGRSQCGVELTEQLAEPGVPTRRRWKAPQHIPNCRGGEVCRPPEVFVACVPVISRFQFEDKGLMDRRSE